MYFKNGTYRIKTNAKKCINEGFLNCATIAVISLVISYNLPHGDRVNGKIHRFPRPLSQNHDKDSFQLKYFRTNCTMLRTSIAEKNKKVYFKGGRRSIIGGGGTYSYIRVPHN